jgi:hypothetical protein
VAAIAVAQKTAPILAFHVPIVPLGPIVPCNPGCQPLCQKLRFGKIILAVVAHMDINGGFAALRPDV